MSELHGSRTPKAIAEVQPGARLPTAILIHLTEERALVLGTYCASYHLSTFRQYEKSAPVLSSLE
jgi:hypothetical protein